MEINKFGFRNAEISEKKPDDTFRAAFMGDSFTEGYGVEVDDGIVAKSEKRFRDHHPNTNFEFINAGIRGGAPTTYRRQLDRFLALSPDALALVSYDNDLADDFYDSVYWDNIRGNVYNKIQRLPFQSRLVEMAGELFIRALRTRAVERGEEIVGGPELHATEIVFASGKVEEDPVGFYARPEAWKVHWQWTRERLDDIADTAESRGIKFAVAYIPCPQAGIHGDCCAGWYPLAEGERAGEDNPFRDWLREFTLDRQLPFIDIGAKFLELEAAGDSEMVFELANGQLKVRGNRLFAELLYETPQSWAPQ
jgi:hypothetical protein